LLFIALSDLRTARASRQTKAATIRSSHKACHAVSGKTRSRSEDLRMANAAHYSHHVPRELVDEQLQSGMKIAIIRNRR
jgi:hypothetical protein